MFPSHTTGGNVWTTGTGVYPNTHTYPHGISIPQQRTIIDGKIMVTVDNKQVELGEILNSIMKRLAILAPSTELHDKYPALQDAYEHYRIIEAMCLSGELSEKESE